MQVNNCNTFWNWDNINTFCVCNVLLSVILSLHCAILLHQDICFLCIRWEIEISPVNLFWQNIWISNWRFPWQQCSSLFESTVTGGRVSHYYGMKCKELRGEWVPRKSFLSCWFQRLRKCKYNNRKLSVV